MKLEKSLGCVAYRCQAKLASQPCVLNAELVELAELSAEPDSVLSGGYRADNAVGQQRPYGSCV